MCLYAKASKTFLHLKPMVSHCVCKTHVGSDDNYHVMRELKNVEGKSYFLCEFFNHFFLKRR
ncbi:hypothetical protein HanRHA438_Chr17g0831011 [Helianthus annuus]|nr:hypothetical protein HanRHA438_Chr17g0831011 [Helianthus annuus]